MLFLSLGVSGWVLLVMSFAVCCLLKLQVGKLLSRFGLIAEVSECGVLAGNFMESPALQVKGNNNKSKASSRVFIKEPLDEMKLMSNNGALLMMSWKLSQFTVGQDLACYFGSLWWWQWPKVVPDWWPLSWSDPSGKLSSMQLLTSPAWDGRENWKSKSEETHGLR